MVETRYATFIVVVVVYHVTIVAMDMGLTFLVIGFVLRTAGSAFI